MTVTSLERLGTRSLKIHLRVGDQIGLAIMRGEYPPGSVLPPELKLCEMLGVSRTAMREAIRGLIAKGLIESRPKLGTRVRHPEYWNHLDLDVLRWQLEVADTETYLRKIFQLRLAAEPAATAVAAENADADDRERLQAAYQAMVDAGSDNVLWVQADLDFHKTIYLATRNEFFWPLGQLFSVALKESFRIAALGAHRPRALAEHHDVLQAILDRKPDVARAAALTLLENAAADLRGIRGHDV